MFEDNAVRALILSSAAGFSTLFGAVIVLFSKGKNEKILSVSLGFAAGVMISVSFTDLYPNAVAAFEETMSRKLSIVLTVAFIVLGLAFAILIDRFVPHEQAEEGSGDKPHKDLYRVGFVSMLAIGLHNLPEGMATFMAGYDSLSLGVAISVAIALHNIPEGVTVALPVYFATGSRKAAFKYTFLSGFAEPVGAFLTFLVLRPFITPFLLAALFAVISGIMIYIAVEELIPSSRQYNHERLALYSTLAGICLMPLTIALQ